MFDEFIEKNKKELIENTCKLIQIPSVNSPSTNPKMPFGENCNTALEFMLSLGKSLGFRTKNIDGYCGYIEFGSGEEIVGIIGHLDVVPEGENWTYPPFSGTIANDSIYGRGAIDDKGPVMASLYAMKAVMDLNCVKKRVRLILGLNEENDWKCIEYYKAHEEIPTIGFSPDADFPCIYAEKALLNVHLSQKNLSSSPLQIVTIDDGQNALNVVPKFCCVTLQISSINIADCFSYLSSLCEENSFNIKILSPDRLCITSYGKAAHSAHPDLGINAISQLLIVLNKLFLHYHVSFEFLTSFCNLIHTQYTGKDLGINYEDESGKLTLNVSKLALKENQIQLSMNLRIPVKTPIATIKKQFHSIYDTTNLEVSFSGEKEPLYLPKDTPLVQTLCTIFNQTTHSNLEPIAIGGATYARAFPNCISFGPTMPNTKDMCHQVDEFIPLDTLLLSTKLYATALYQLSR